MAQATVFVDDAVLGHLPPICVKEGIPTSDSLTLHSKVGDGSGLGVAWLLLLAGPLGWLGLLVFASTRRPTDVLTVQLPFSEDAYRQLRQAKRAQGPLMVAISALLIGGLFALGHHNRLLAAILAVALILAIARWVLAILQVRDHSVTVSLDASRRWVTLGRVHPTFADGCSGASPFLRDGSFDIG